MAPPHDVFADADPDPEAEKRAEYVGKLAKFLRKLHSDDVRRILLHPEPNLHFPLVIDFADFLEFDPGLANILYTNPKGFLPLFEEATQLAQNVELGVLNKIEALGNPDELKPAAVQKDFVHVRIDITGSPLEFPESSPSIGKVRVKHRGTLLTLKGTVIRSGGVKMIEGERKYQCRKCNYRFTCYPELEAGNRITLPASCPSMSSRGCQSASFQLIEDSITCHDYQEIKIQESVQLLEVGSIPRSMPVILMDDLVDIVKAGDDVILTGILSAKWSSDVKDVRCNLDPMFIANYVRRTNELKSGIDIPEEIVKEFDLFWAEYGATPLKGRNKILEGICPQIYGLFTVKLAVALTLIGGVQHVDASGTKVRGEPHMLLVGDPGTGKSQFLKFAAKLSNRSVITTGLGSTSAGLTVTAVKDGGEWMLEAGALVLADGGLCCIDEFDSMREHDRTTIHEAMEQQTISIAKAGLVTTLSTKTTVFGATNPKGQYDPNECTALTHQTNTKPDKENISDSGVKSTLLPVIKKWTLPLLRRYIHYIKQRFKPVLTKEAERAISGYYQLQRRSGTQNAARTTVRMLESLIRLAQAHARLMFRNEVTQLDAIAAILCIESSMTTSSIIDGAGNALNSNFWENPDQECILTYHLIPYLFKNIKDLTNKNLN
ncbi:probable DNA helicase MCM9 isoform X3 [Brachypodium distachyon]|uniref:probable DNA helicase MCM9 isoform X3 n=1 Tax=Brachypodium distachyon TaxID=15368 RepID=UPI000D0CE018|nr:probable DNA helicase MCM9 isoform X3 [Brachypodium distachyon]|eukprot:XP_024313395.1 probable DNA helicase MCM9 isoform X3 [Brachypodium distachyon]